MFTGVNESIAKGIVYWAEMTGKAFPAEKLEYVKAQRLRSMFRNGEQFQETRADME